MDRNKTIFFLVVIFIAIYGIVICVLALNALSKYANKMRQLAQFNHIQGKIELFKKEFGSYPPSSALDTTDQHYCGAMKLWEAVWGQDFMGFNKESVFRSDGMNDLGTDKLYGEDVVYDPNVRMAPLLNDENVEAYRLSEIYEDVGPFDGNDYVLCDTYLKKRHSGKRTGMPILYYKADTMQNLHDPNTSPTPSDSKGNIYNYWDNHELVRLGIPGKKSAHSMADPVRFYRNTEISYVTKENRPNRRDSFLLISAGYDGQYGTADDICYFPWQYRE
jgi:hypothetical protein